MRRALALIGTTLFAVTALHATDLVVFEDGRGIRVGAFVIADGLAQLTLEDGSTLGVPSGSIVAVERAIDPGDLLPAAEPLRPEEATALADDLRAGERWRQAAGKHADLIAAAADRNALDRAFLAAVAKIESNFDPFAVSPRGACGVLQLMPKTAKRFGVRNLFDAAENIDGGARYLRWLLDRFDGRVDLALAAYNAGEGAVDHHHGIPPYAETRGYVIKVLDHMTRTAQPSSR
ncbi:MAG TPA: lytic transglycosylase domain-containing protein [Candidatus Polarisedimenticolaceae bacterium]|nr:lytic transglycosylase domain-containing protein [Candidatus Polarisedimenticolaceae bacterium]